MPKKPDNKAAKKEKELTKIAKDVTFGMKNKNKSNKVQNLVQNMAAGSKGGYSKLQEDIFKEKKVKAQLEEEHKLMVDVFTKVVPKPVMLGSTGEEVQICQFFKAGLCQKGKKCKFSHNLGGEPMRVEKMDLYTDQRDQIFARDDTIKTWDAEKLSEVVDFNEGKYSAPNRTDKVCKNFLEAVEKKTYGWMWVCPNGYNCVFRHALPEGYQFKGAKRDEEKDDDGDIIAEIDEQRDRLSAKTLTPVTEESFMKWLEGRKIRRDKERAEKTKEELKKMGVKTKKNITGRELFDREKDLFADADDAVEEYEREEEVPQPEDEDAEKEKQDGQDANVNVDAELFADEEVPDF
jgi:hypothetical protein